MFVFYSHGVVVYAEEVGKGAPSTVVCVCPTEELAIFIAERMGDQREMSGVSTYDDDRDCRDLRLMLYYGVSWNDLQKRR